MIVPDLAKKISQVALDTLEQDNVYENVISYVLHKYSIELSMVTDHETRYNIVNDRVGAVLEEIGLVKDLSDIIKNLGLGDRLKELQEEKATLLEKQTALTVKLNSLTNQLIDLQTSIFGRIEFKVDNLADVEPIKIETPDKLLKEDHVVNPAPYISKSWRQIRPTELLLGIRGYNRQPVFIITDNNVWIKGVVENVIERDEPLSLIDLNRHSSTNGAMRISPTERQHSDSRPASSSLRYLVSTDNDFRETVDSSRLALGLSSEELTQRYPVGARVVARYIDPHGVSDYYSGTIGEPPKLDNEYRYLIFFDDGYAYYAQPSCVFRMFNQSKENWQSVNRNFQEFMKIYLHNFPKRQLLKLNVDQVIRAQLNGNWLQAKVVKVDSSLVMLEYPSGNLEWIYRGSERLGPTIFNSEPQESPPDESVPFKSTGTRRRFTGRRSTAAGAVPSSVSRIHQPGTSSEPYVQPSMREALMVGVIEPYLGSFKDSMQIKPYVDHKCSGRCLRTLANPNDPSVGYLSENPLSYKGINPLEIPLRAGWTRIYLKATPAAPLRDVIAYMAPCKRQIRGLSELEHFLYQTDSQLTSDLFSFDKEVRIDAEYRCEKAFIRIADLSYKKENVPIPCVNSLDNDAPPYMEYITQRMPFGNVKIDNDPGFMVCCDCTDNCRDKTKCACQQLTIEASGISSENGMVDSSAGYRHRRLFKHHRGSVYECNPGCKCDRRCQNRVVQNGLWLRLQVFKTQRKGWGIRALNAIPRGTFICTYAGLIYNDSLAVTRGQTIGDEYQADLDYIEVVETRKEGYEENVIMPTSDDETPLRPAHLQSSVRSSRTARKSNPSRNNRQRRNSGSSSVSSARSVRPPSEATTVEVVGVDKFEKEEEGEEETRESGKEEDRQSAATTYSDSQEPNESTIPAGLQFTDGISNLEEILSSVSFELEPHLELTRVRLSTLTSFPTSMDSRRGRPRSFARGRRGRRSTHGANRRDSRAGSTVGDMVKSASNADLVLSSTQPEGLRKSNSAADLQGRERRNHGKVSVVTVSSNDAKVEVTQTIGTTGPIPWANRRSYPIRQPDWVKAREYFGDEGPFVMDAKQVGNLGRYFNHSCQPNIFAQSVFASNHDPRFPDVAFFALRNIEAGEELSWDYGYVTGSVPSKVLYCYCNEEFCRKQLL
nr:histone lysine n methyltransferase setb1 [Hymenolepis microstoma]